jgi:hypothetical protein
MGYATYFAQDLPGPQLRVLSATQGPWFAGCLADNVTLAAWRFKPSRWVLPEHDRMIDPRFQLAMATRANAAVTTIAGSHLVMVSHPRKVADVIADAAYALP